MKKLLSKHKNSLIDTLSRSVAHQITRNNIRIGTKMWTDAATSTVDYIYKAMPYALWFTDNKAVTYTGIMIRFWNFSVANVSIPGSFLELGCGLNSTKVIANAIKTNNGILHGFDSFEGNPEVMGSSGVGKYGLSHDGRIPDTLQALDNAVFHKGWYEDTLPEFLNENNDDIAYMHLDCNLYSSHKTAFYLLGKRIKPGTIIVFDDYFHFPMWTKFAYKAFSEFVKEHNVKYEYLAYKGGWENGTENGSVIVKILALSNKDT